MIARTATLTVYNSLSGFRLVGTKHNKLFGHVKIFYVGPIEFFNSLRKHFIGLIVKGHRTGNHFDSADSRISNISSRWTRKMVWRKRFVRSRATQRRTRCETGITLTIGYWKSNTKICWLTNRTFSQSSSSTMASPNRPCSSRFNSQINAVSKKSPVGPSANQKRTATFAAGSPASGKTCFQEIICV